MNSKIKTKENRFRRILYRNGYSLKKERNIRAVNPGYMIVDFNNNAVSGVSPAFSLNLEDVEDFIQREKLK